MVTRAASETNLGKEIFTQLTSIPKALWMVSGAVFTMGIVPGMPTLPFLILSAILGFSGYIMHLTLKEREKTEKEEKAKEIIKQLEEEQPESYISPPEVLTFEIGYRLIKLVDESQGGELIKRIKNLRKQLSKELGLIVPPVHIKDNLELKPNEYRILIKGIEVARYEVEPEKYLALDTGSIREKVEGVPTKDPAFGLNALWVDEANKDRAKLNGYTVVDVSTVIVTHLSEIIKRYSYEILTRMQVKEIIDNIAKNYPIIKDIVPSQVPLNILHKVLQNLLKEGIPITDIIAIVEALADNINKTQDPDILTEYVRAALSRMITSMFAKNGQLTALILGNKTQEYLINLLKENDWQMPPLNPVFIQKLIAEISKHLENFIIQGTTPVLLTSPNIRRYIKQIIENYIPNLQVLSYSEIDSKIKLNIIGVVEVDGT
jgi:flagellar biosynthesis protein FlhA